MRLTASDIIRISHAKFHRNRLTTVQVYKIFKITQVLFFGERHCRCNGNENKAYQQRCDRDMLEIQTLLNSVTFPLFITYTATVFEVKTCCR